MSTERALATDAMCAARKVRAVRAVRAAALAAAAGLLAGCQSLPPVQAWEKGLLARPEMKLDAAKLEGSFADHVYTSKEAGLPGRGVGAGGCGCN
jgi:hypothetical protein